METNFTTIENMEPALVDVSWISSWTEAGRPRHSKLHLMTGERVSKWDKVKTLCGQEVPAHAAQGELDSGICKACRRIKNAQK